MFGDICSLPADFCTGMPHSIGWKCLQWPVRVTGVSGGTGNGQAVFFLKSFSDLSLRSSSVRSHNCRVGYVTGIRQYKAEELRPACLPGIPAVCPIISPRECPIRSPGECPIRSSERMFRVRKGFGHRGMRASLSMFVGSPAACCTGENYIGRPCCVCTAVHVDRRL